MSASQDHKLAQLRGASWLKQSETQAVFTALTAAGHVSRAVGGAVRNTLMGLPVSDIDIATTARPDEVIVAAERAGLKVFATGLQHGTVTVMSGGVPHEVTTLRKDVDSDGRHARVAFTSDWRVDARRRDFTMNALYCDADGTLFDPLDGYGDLVGRHVRFIDDARERIREDYLRILRFFRFNAQFGSGRADDGGGIDARGLSACIAERAGLVHLSAERIRVEMLKLLGAKHAMAVCSIMLETGFLSSILGIVPRLSSLRRLITLEGQLELTADPVLRLAILSVAVSDDVSRLSRRLRLSRAEARTISFAGNPDAPGNPICATLSEDEAKRLLYRWGVERYQTRILIMWAARGPLDLNDDSYALWHALYELPNRWAVPQMPVSGGDLVAMGVGAGPAVGGCLREFERWWIDAGFPENKAAYLPTLKQIVADC